MDGHNSGCILCGSPLVYSEKQSMRECISCRQFFLSNASCSRGHFVCDRCHSGNVLNLVIGYCRETDSKDPGTILGGLMSLPGVHMHGPEHHVLIGSALITAYRNAGGELDIIEALEEMRRRSENVPGGVCGNWGTCGAAISCGIAYSVIHGTTPLSEENWALGNRLTSECLLAISKRGGPRCCKRDGYLALGAAVRFIRKHDRIRMEYGKNRCVFSSQNRQCLGGKCPFHS